MALLTASRAWIEACPAACVGAMAMSGVRNPDSEPALEAMLDETAAQLRDKLAGTSRADLLARPELAAYAAYYRRFDKTYHVLLQIESVAFKGKPIRARGSLVAAMFRAELRTGLLTAGHDADLLAGGLQVAVAAAAAGDAYTGIGGRQVTAAAGDMCIRDGKGIVSSIVYGPDDRTRLGPETSRAVFTTYGPAGIGPEVVRHHLAEIADTIRAIYPTASIDEISLVPAV